MKTSASSLCALFAGCVVIAACSKPTELSPFRYLPNVNGVPDRASGALSYRVLHTFGADHDGNGPLDLISVGDTFYGTTDFGGAHGFGTVFSITTGGTEKVLHSFDKGTYGNGSQPNAGLIDVGGTFYGTTYFGGAFGDGTVFSITPDGKEKVLHSFGKGTDGQYPAAGLTDVGGTLYGTTESGGTNECGFRFRRFSCGTVFSITTDGEERVLHNFGKGRDGYQPAAAMTNLHGTLYGTTSGGGAYGDYEYGTVFSITPDGKEKVLHSFGKGSDGAAPGGGASLLDVKGTLYGTTAAGGTHNKGTVFSITRGGSEKVLHSFSGTDGDFPNGRLIDVGDSLYGTTVSGGTNSCGRNAGGCGTVFSITTGGEEKVLHNFSGRFGGNAPDAGLKYESGRFFGTTGSGGAYGGGTVFSLTP